MTTLRVPDENLELTEYAKIQQFLNDRGVLFERWEARAALRDDATQEEVLEAYSHRLDPYMKENGYTTADVVVLYPDHPQREAVRAKFLSEHTHTEDEVRFFVDGAGDFWFHLQRDGKDEVFAVRCERGDLISVPANTTHWFDCFERPFVKAIRVFIDPAGWVPHYTGSGIEKRYTV